MTLWQAGLLTIVVFAIIGIIRWLSACAEAFPRQDYYEEDRDTLLRGRGKDE